MKELIDFIETSLPLFETKDDEKDGDNLDMKKSGHMSVTSATSSMSEYDESSSSSFSRDLCIEHKREEKGDNEKGVLLPTLKEQQRAINDLRGRKDPIALPTKASSIRERALVFGGAKND